MGDYYYHNIIIESALTLLEIIHKNDKPITITQTMENDNIVFIIRKTFENGASVTSIVCVRKEPYLVTDLQGLFLTFYQTLNYN